MQLEHAVVRHVGDDLASAVVGARRRFDLPRCEHGVARRAEDEHRRHVGSPPVSFMMARMQRWPKSTPGPNIIGHAPAITLMSCSRQYSTAAGETLEPFARD